MKKPSEQQILEEINLFNHRYKSQVRFSEIDSMNIVHNIQYFYFIEFARIKYFEQIGINVNKNTFHSENIIITVHHEMDYFNSLNFFDEYEVLTRVSFIKNSSVTFENMILNSNGRLIVKAKTIFVYADSETKLPTRVSDEIRQKISAFENENCKFLD